MIPRYTSTGTMIQDPNGTYVAAADYESLKVELAQSVIEKFKAVKRGDMSAEAALSALFVVARLSA